MSSQKRKRNSEHDVSLHQNSDMQKNKKMRLNQNRFTENYFTTQQESVTLPMCKSDGTFDSKLIFQKFRRKLTKDKKSNMGKSWVLYDSSGSVWNVIEKTKVMKSCSDEDNFDLKKVCQKKKSEINRAAGEVDVRNLISVQSSELNGVKEEIPHTFERNYNNENKTLPKVKKKQRFIQPEMCCSIQDNMPLVFERKKLKKNEVQNIDNTISWKQNDVFGRITNEVQMKKEKRRGVELGKEETTKGVKKNKKIKMLPNIANDVSDECEKNDVLNEVNIIKEHNVRVVNEGNDVRESERESGNVTEQKMSKKKRRKSKRHSIENSLETDHITMECAGEIDKENEGNGVQYGEIKENKLQREKEASGNERKKLSLERGSELEKEIEWEQVSEENLLSPKETLKEHIENEVHSTHVEKIFDDNEGVVEDSGGKDKKKRKKKLERLKNKGKQRPNSVNIVCDPFGGKDADIDSNSSEQNNEDETIGRIKKKVVKLSIESEDEEEDSEKGDGKASSENEMVVNGDMSKYWCAAEDSKEEEEEDDFIVDDNYVSFDENATTSDEEFEETECSSDDCSGSGNEDSSEVQEEGEEEQCLPVRKERKKKMALQFFDLEAEEGQETDMEDEEEEASSEEDSDDDSVVDVEQFIDSEAKEEITFVRKKKKVRAIESEEEEEEKEEKKYPETESLEKTVHIMKKLTRLMTVGVLKGKTRKQNRITSKEIDIDHDSKVRISRNESIDFTVRAVNEKKKTILDGKSANQKIEELRIQQKVDEEIREILGEDKLGKKKRRKSATDWGRGYASEPEYVDVKKPSVKI